MWTRFRPVVPFAALACATLALAQPGATLSGTVEGWQDGEADIVLLAPRHLPPAFVRPAEAPTVGTVAADGSFSISVPESFPREAFVPVVDFLDPGCTGAELVPEDARYFPVTYGVYGGDGDLVGEIFQASPGPDSARGPAPGGYSLLPGYSDEGFVLRGSCPDPGRRVVEEYDVAVGPGWHNIVQRFEEDPERSGWRIDRWRDGPVPEDARWIMIRPPG